MRKSLKTILGLLSIALFLGGIYENVYAQEKTDDAKVDIILETTLETDGEAYSQEELDETKKEMLSDLDFTEIDNVVDELLNTKDVSFSDLVGRLVSGQEQMDGQQLTQLIKELFFGELSHQKQLLLQIFLMVLAAALLMNVTHVFEDGQISEMAFFMIYLVVFALLLKAFGSLSGELSKVMAQVVDFMKILTPAYYLSIMASNGAATASAYYQIVLFVITGVQWGMLKIVLPGINLFVLLGIVNNLSKEDILSKLADLMRTIMEWLMKSMIGLIVGLQVIQKMVTPMIDSLQRTVIGKTASAIPGIGNVIDSVTEMVVGCAMLIRNCVGAAALIILLLAAVSPLIQLAVTTLSYKALAALTQPIADKRLVGCITVMGDGCALLLRALLTVEILFLVTVAIVAAGGSA